LTIGIVSDRYYQRCW